MYLTDEQWQLLQPLFPPPPTSRRGRPPLDDRDVLNAVLYRLATGDPWYDLPDDFPAHQTCYRRYRQWRRSGLLAEILVTLYDDLHTRGGFDLLQVIRSGDIAYVPHGRSWGVHIAPHLPHDWQLATALIFFGIARKALPRSVPLQLKSQSPPAWTEYQPLDGGRAEEIRVD